MITRTPRITKKAMKELVACFLEDKLGATDSAVRAKVNKNTAHLWFRHFRELIYADTGKAPRFFGEVEMDQAEFGGRGARRLKELLARYSKILTYSEYQKKARQIRKEHKVQVFGMYLRDGQVYTKIIKRADRDTLMPIIRLVVEQGSTVLTDRWRGFSELGLDGYTHKSVNHSVEYVARDGTHINGIESFWSFAKRRLTKFNGIAMTTIPLHIKEGEWRWNHREDLRGAFQKLLASDIYMENALARHFRTRRRPRKSNGPASPHPIEVQ